MKTNFAKDLKKFLNVIQLDISCLRKWKRSDCSLRISVKKNRIEYYEVGDPKYPQGKYLSKKEDMQTIRDLAQQDYENSLLEEYEKLEKEVKHFLGVLDGIPSPKQVYENLDPERKALVNQVDLGDFVAKLWLEKNRHLCANRRDKGTINETDNGEYVRSRIEDIIANKFKARGIPYLYEVEVQVSSTQFRFVDFLVLNKRTGKAYYYEHFGKMGSPSYVSETMTKLREYESIGLYLGVNLLATFEDESHVLSTAMIDKLIDNFLV